MKQRSFIYSMLAGVAVFTLASCADSVSEFFGLEDKDVITFTATTDNEVSDLTRAAINEDSRVTVFKDTQPKKPLLLSSSVTKRDVEATRGHRVTSATELSKFRVLAAIGSKNISEEDFALLTPNYFYNVKAEKSNNIYEIERDYYWPSSSEKLWFYAYAPCDDNNVVISDQNLGGPQKVTFSVDTDVTKQVDLMTADASTTAFTAASGETTKTSVALGFRHELTAIRFIIGEQWLAGSIKSIGIYNVHGKGTMTIGADDANKWAWTNKAGTATYSATDDFVLTVDKGGLTGAVNEQFIKDENLYFLMIPQSFDDNNDAYVEVKYQDNAREYTVTAPLKGQSAWVRNTTVTYAISSHELTKLKVNSIAWPSNSGEGVWNGPKTNFVAGDEVGLYVVDPDGQTIQEYYRNVKCTFDGGHWTVNHPENHPVYKLPGYQYFFYYPYTPTPDTKYPVEGQHNTNTAATAFFSHLIDGWAPAAVQNTQSTLAAQDLQVSKGVDDAQLSSTVNAEMAHQMSIGKLLLGKSQATDTYIYQVDNDHKWYYHPAKRDVTASNNFSTNKPYLHSDGNYYFIFKPVDSTSDAGTLLKGLDGTTVDWSWEMKSTDRGKTLTHTAISADEGKNTVYTDKLVFTPIADLTANGGNVTVPVEVLLNNSALTKGTHYTVSFKNASNQTVTAPTVAGNYTAIFTPKGIYWGDDVSLAFTVNKDGKTITFGNVTQVNKTYGDAAFTQAVTKTGTGTVTYSSSNTNVATVNLSTGQVTIKAAGSATITATVADSQYDHYATNTASYTLTVAKKAVTVTAKAQSVYYGTAIATGTGQITVSGLLSGHSVSAVTLTQSTTNATTNGSITPSAAAIKDGSNNDMTDNYSISYAPGTLTITAKTVSSPTITLGTTSYTYDGSAKQPTVTVKDGSTTIASSEYTVSYSNNVNAGTATCTITDKSGGNYTVSGSKTFTINRATPTITLSTTSLSITNINTATFTVTRSGNGNITASSNNTNIATTSVNQSTGVVTVTSVGAGTATITVTLAQGTNYNAYTATNKTVSVPVTLNMGVNPLWWVAQYNMKAKNSMQTSHSLATSYEWTYANAQTITYSGYHIPSRNEQVSIIPSDKSSGQGNNLWGNGTASKPSAFSEILSNVGGTNVAASTSYWYSKGGGDSYAVRFIGTNYASAWHYKWVTSPCKGLLIESFLIPKSMTVAQAKALLAGFASSISPFTGSLGASAANQTPGSSTATKQGFTQRFIAAYGLGASADGSDGNRGAYWSSTADGSTGGFHWNFWNNSTSTLANYLLHEHSHEKTYWGAVRLFRDH